MKATESNRVPLIDEYTMKMMSIKFLYMFENNIGAFSDKEDALVRELVSMSDEQRLEKVIDDWRIGLLIPNDKKTDVIKEIMAAYINL